MDQGFTGLCDTLDALDEIGLAHVGTYRTQEEFDENMGVTVADVGGITVAFLDYTYGTNGIPVSDERTFSVNLFNTDYLTDLSKPDTKSSAGSLIMPNP
jgi:poly-gamma-glutamate synthesis protein (capsule biosynthesis protein)